MAISYENGCREFLISALARTGQPLQHLAICDLGNQKFKTAPGSGMDRIQSAGSVYRFLGVGEYVCIDRNGRDGALPFDLSKPIEDEALHQRFDVVCNFGTSEHVKDDQRQCFANVHRLTKPNGLMVHCLPHVGTCRHHGYWKYDAAFFRLLAERLGYEVVLIDTYDKSQGYPDKEPGSEIYVRALLRMPGKVGRFPKRFTNPVRE